MREYTKALKAEAQKDIIAIKVFNWNKWNTRTPEERIQSIRDRRKFYQSKWNKLWYSAETKAQKGYCDRVLAAVDNYLGQGAEKYASMDI